MKIFNMNDEKIRARFEFIHKGYVISCSSMFNADRVEVGYWLYGLDEIVTVNSVPQAIRAIDLMELNS